MVLCTAVDTPRRVLPAVISVLAFTAAGGAHLVAAALPAEAGATSSTTITVKVGAPLHEVNKM